MSTNKEIIKIETIRTLADLFPNMTVVEWLKLERTDKGGGTK